MNKKNIFIRAVAAVLLTAFLTFTLCSCAPLESTDQKEDPTDFTELALIDKLFKAYANYDIDEEKILEAVLDAYIEATGDIYAEYYNEEEYKKWRDDSNAQLVGIGVRIELVTINYDGKDQSAVKIISVMDNSPALEVGVLPNDYIYAAFDGEKYVTVDDIGYTAFSNLIVGEEGTSVKVRVLRKNQNGDLEPHDYEITRARIETLSVKGHICETDSAVGIVKISEFNYKTPYQFDNVMDDLIGKGVKKFVFDLRFNPGGSLTSIVAVLSRFLQKDDLVVSTIDKSGKEAKRYVEVISYTGDYEYCSVTEEDIGKYRGYTYSVLVNQNTASAAELFTATFRDYNLANIVGVTTYGKGCMQTIIPLDSYGYKGAVKMTTKYYYSMCGIGYHGIGISPTKGYEIELGEGLEDRFNSLTDAEDNQLMRAVEAIYARIQ